VGACRRDVQRMSLFVWRAIRARWPSFLVTTLGLGLAFGCALACLSVVQVLRGGHPVGSHFDGDPVTIYQHVLSMGYDLFLSPAQIAQVQQELGDSGTVTGSSGGAFESAELNGEPMAVAVDVVLPNHFSVLGIHLIGADPERWGQGDETVIVSQRFLARLGLTTPPKSIRIAGQDFPIAGVADAFPGLWNHEIEVWVDWRQGQRLLFPTSVNRGVNQQPPLYWALAIPAEGKSAEFAARLQRALARTDIAERPFDKLRAVSGITNQSELRQAADTSTSLYLLSCGLMLLVGAFNLASWSALTRVSRLDAEWTMLRLGIPRLAYFRIGLWFVLIPAVVGAILAVPFHWLFAWLLASDPAIASLLEASSEYQRSYPWFAWVAVFALTCVLGHGLGSLVSTVAGLRYGAVSLRSDQAAVRQVFRGVVIVVSMASAIAMVFAAFASLGGYRLLRDMAYPDASQVWMLGLRSGNAATRFDWNAENMDRLVEEVRVRMPELAAVGFLQVRPFSSAKPGSTVLSLEPFGAPDLSVMLNEATYEALPALGLPVVRGKGFSQHGGEAAEIVLDTAAADLFSSSHGGKDVLDQLLYDAAGTAYRVVGVSQRSLYSTDLNSALPVAYASMTESIRPPILITRGPTTAERIQRQLVQAKDSLFPGVVVESPLNLRDLSDQTFAGYRSRSMLCVISALVTLVIAFISLVSIISLEVARNRRALAVRACLGASTGELMRRSVRGLSVCVVGGSMVGFALLWFARSALPTDLITSAGDWFWMGGVSVTALLLLVLLCASIALRRLFFGAALSDHLREE